MSEWQPVKTSAATRWALATAGYACAVAVTLLVGVTSIDRLITAWFKPEVAVTIVRPTKSATPAPSQNITIVRNASMIPTNDEWAEKLRDPAFWKKSKSSGSSKSNAWTAPAWTSPGPPKWNFGAPVMAPAAVIIVPRGKSRNIEIKENDSDNEDDTYRTVCVRICDGAFFPLSFSTTRENFEADAARCDKTCAGSRMFFYKNPGSELADMEDLKGLPYKKLPTAFLFRTTYDASCKCRAHPWEEASRNQHRVYALESQRAKGDKIAATELNDLKAKMVKAERDAIAERKRAELEKVAEVKRLAYEAKAAKAKSRQTAQAERANAQAAKVSEPSSQANQIKASANIPSAKGATTNLWGPKPLLVPTLTTPAAMSVPRAGSFTPVPALRASQMGLGAR